MDITMHDSGKPRTCEVHESTMALINKIDERTLALLSGQMDIKENLIRLTENLFEMQRLNKRFDHVVEELKIKDEKQDEKIDKNSGFVNKAIGVVGAISLIAAIGTVVMSILTFFLK